MKPCPLLLSVMPLSPQYLPLSTKLEDQLRSCQEHSKAVNYTTPQYRKRLPLSSKLSESGQLRRLQFHLITDQRSVAFMLDKRKRTKIKNNKIQRRQLELASYGYTIQYRSGRENDGSDTLTRATRASMTNSLSKESGVTRLLHFVRTNNLPYSTDDVKKLCHLCRICAELKPQFYRPQQNTLIKATEPMERWSIYFKGPQIIISEYIHAYYS